MLVDICRDILHLSITFVYYQNSKLPLGKRMCLRDQWNLHFGYIQAILAIAVVQLFCFHWLPYHFSEMCVQCTFRIHIYITRKGGSEYLIAVWPYGDIHCKYELHPTMTSREKYRRTLNTPLLAHFRIGRMNNWSPAASHWMASHSSSHFKPWRGCQSCADIKPRRAVF